MELGNLLVQDRTFYAQVVQFIQNLAFVHTQRKYFTLQHVQSKPRIRVLQASEQLRIILRLKNCHFLTLVNKSILSSSHFIYLLLSSKFKRRTLKGETITNEFWVKGFISLEGIVCGIHSPDLQM